MEVINKIAPSEQQARRFTEPGHDRPIYMLNLLKFKEKAEYEDARETSLSGAEAYAIYGKEVAGHLAKVGVLQHSQPALKASGWGKWKSFGTWQLSLCIPPAAPWWR